MHLLGRTTILAFGLLLLLTGFCGSSSNGTGSDDPDPETAYAIGDEGPAGGWAFYVTGDGLHGMEASPVNLINARWGCHGYDLQGADGSEIGTGATNTAEILDACTETPIAADRAIFYTLNGFFDWFLPSFEELELMYLNIGQGSTTIGNVGGFTDIAYWSSTEIDNRRARAFWFGGLSAGLQYKSKKSRVLGVRAIRTF
ncbi:MAG: hypothetical protein GY815_02000 [Gammaproteobacteria bacterium]|nr:hypothetical protein [Gammaproteobacteria bacterium]